MRHPGRAVTREVFDRVALFYDLPERLQVEVAAACARSCQCPATKCQKKPTIGAKETYYVWHTCALVDNGLLARTLFHFVGRRVDAHKEPHVKVHVHAEEGDNVTLVSVGVRLDAREDLKNAPNSVL